MVIASSTPCDAVIRKLPGALGHADSAAEESFSEALGGAPEYPQYTRPAEYRGWRVPKVLLSGHHELIREWRNDRLLRRLEAMLLIADKDNLFILSGEGDVIEPDEQVAAIGSGAGYATAAAKALALHSTLNAAEIATAAMQIAADLCVYTNDKITVETVRPHA